MSSVQCLRQFVTERLTAAAEEIFRVFEKTIVEYEEEIDRQRRLLDVVWKPEVKLHRIDLKVVSNSVSPPPDHLHVCRKEDAESVQQLFTQQRNFSLGQEEPEPPQIKEEQEELFTSQEVQQQTLTQNTVDVMLTPTCEESEHNEPDPEPVSDHQLLSHSSAVAESQDQTGNNHVDSESTRKTKTELQPRRNYHKKTSGKRFKCDTCEKFFSSNRVLKLHQTIHTGEKPYACDTCGKRFPYLSSLTNHIRIHTGEKPHACDTCGKRFSESSKLRIHVRTHTGEKPYLCNSCGKRFICAAALTCHMRFHTGEKPYVCVLCGKQYTSLSGYKAHMEIHTSQKWYFCSTCGKRFKSNLSLQSHLKAHRAKKTL